MLNKKNLKVTKTFTGTVECPCATTNYGALTLTFGMVGTKDIPIVMLEITSTSEEPSLDLNKENAREVANLLLEWAGNE